MGARVMTRIAVDIVLTAMIGFEMLIQYTGNLLHEIVGFAFFASILLHLLLSAQWIKGTAKNVWDGRMTGRRTALAVMGILLALCMAVLGVSSVAISGLLAQAGFTWTFGSYATWAAIHSASSYALCALVTVHLGMHWAFLASVFRVPYDPSRRRAIGVGVNAVAALGAVALGVTAVKEAMPQVASWGVAAAAENESFETISDVGQEQSENVEKSAESSESSESGSSGASGSSSEAQDKTESRARKRNGKKHRSASEASAQETAPQAESGDEAIGDAGESADQTSGEEANSGDGWSSDYDWSSGEDTGPDDSWDAGSSWGLDDGAYTVTGICTLCRKQCPLSAPQCNRPYEAGLL